MKGKGGCFLLAAPLAQSSVALQACTMASRGALLRCWLLVVCLAAGSHAWKKSGGIEDKLADWVISKGGKLVSAAVCARCR